ncbi:hypothetical protein LguiA_012781 [Lonicera macranthoides]
MEMEHFSHEHPLKLTDEAQRNKRDEEILCDGCRESIIGSAYTCSECEYILHKKCAELPKQINHPMHIEHPLTLFSHPPYSYSLYSLFSCTCNVCKIYGWKWFTYHCSICKFDVHIHCASEKSEIKHEGHHHPLTFVERSSLFDCDACDTKEEDVSYRCTTCPFWIHKACAMLPRTITRSYDDHPLILAFSLPTNYHKFEQLCRICHMIVRPSYWSYHCALCRYFFHLKCAMVEKEPLTLRAVEEYLDSNLMNFPLPDKSVDAISRYVKLISLKDVNDIAREIFHPSHKHLLILLDVQSDDAEMINTELCRGCSRRISVSFYTCKDCNFFLHKCCAELPREIQHPLHAEHPLRQCWPKYFFSYTNCDLCKKFTSGFVFRCSTCNFRLDVHCACLPKAIKHDAHDHPLKLETQISRCSGCNNFTRTIYGCATCSEFNLAICCVNLSRTFKHEWDHHPLTLSYPPFSYHPDEFICEICEEDIHPNYWLYHCRQCDQSFHTNCINFDLYSDVKFGGTLQVENHPHPLVYVRKSKSKFPSICSQCGLTRYDWPVLECACCNFQLCHNCGYRIVESLPSTS